MHGDDFATREYRESEGVTNELGGSHQDHFESELIDRSSSAGYYFGWREISAHRVEREGQGHLANLDGDSTFVPTTARTHHVRQLRRGTLRAHRATRKFKFPVRRATRPRLGLGRFALRDCHD